MRGRPMKQGLKYFSFDCDFFENDKIKLIEAEFGQKGMLILIRLLCKIYKDDGYFYKWGEDQCLLLTKAMGAEFVQKTLIDEVVAGCVRRRFFDKRCFDLFGILTSSEIQHRFIEGIAKRKQIFLIKEYWVLDYYPKCDYVMESLNEITEGDNITQNDRTENELLINSDINSINSRIKSKKVGNNSHIKSNQIILNNIEREIENKAKISNFKIPSLEEIETFLQNDKIINYTAKDFYEHYQECDWQINGETIKSWKAVARTWKNKNGKSKSQNSYSTAAKPTTGQQSVREAIAATGRDLGETTAEEFAEIKRLKQARRVQEQYNSSST